MKVCIAILFCGVVWHQTVGLETVIDSGKLIFNTSYNATHVTVQAIGETIGYIGFGVSPDGFGMTGADIIMAGCNDTSQEPYAVDHIGTGNSRPTEDFIQNAQAVSCSQNATHTNVVFNRPIRSDDVNQDVPIESGPISIIWSIGSSDALNTYHGTNRGVVSIDILGRND